MLTKSCHKIWLSALSICLVIAILTVAVCLSISPADEAIGLLTHTVVIDAGHGGIDSGTTGVVTGNRESDLNLLVARALLSKLEGAGLGTVMTRDGKDGLYGTLSPGFKRRDMERRAAIISASAPTVTVSIHMNKYASPSRRGAQVYYQKNDPEGQALANVLQSVLNAEINLKEGGRAFSALSGDFYVCRVSPCPAVIVECGFLSSPEDDRLLATDEYRQRLATAIKNGVCEYLALMTVAP